MKKRIVLFFAVMLIFTLAGCQDDEGIVRTHTITTNGVDGQCVIGNPEPDIKSEETITITRPDLRIYTGPGYDYKDIGTLLDVGTYTITEQFVCDEKITWGKLKSGVGWINLDQARDEAPHIPITLERIEKNALNEENSYVYLREETDYTQYLLIQPYETLTDVRLTFMNFADDGFQPGEVLYTLEKLTPEKPLVLGVVFYGDFTTFGLSFFDAEGNACQYMIYTSGRNGSVVLQKKEG